MKTSKLIGNDQIVFFDCDDSLVMWLGKHWEPGNDKIELTDPYDQSIVYLKPHHRHIGLIKKYKLQGYTVIVWSAGGQLWAEEVVNKLKINDYVDGIMSKPLKFVDDLQATEILGSRVYIEYKENE